MALSASGREARQPAPRSAANHSPLLISTTAPSVTSPIVGSPSPSGASATLVQAASRPGERRPRAVDRVDDQHALRRRRRGVHEPAVLGVERDLRRVGRDPALEERLRLGVDRERDVAARALARVRATVLRAEPRDHDLAQRVREIGRDASHPLGSRGGFSGRSPSSSSSVALLAVAVDLDGDLLARVERLHGLGEVVGVADRAVVDAGDDVAALGERARLEADLAAAAAQPGLLARAVGLHDLQPRALADRAGRSARRAAGRAAPTARRGRRSGPRRPRAGRRASAARRRRGPRSRRPRRRRSAT